MTALDVFFSLIAERTSDEGRYTESIQCQRKSLKEKDSASSVRCGWSFGRWLPALSLSVLC